MKPLVNALTLALIEYDPGNNVAEAKEFAEKFFAENADLFGVEMFTAVMPVLGRGEVLPEFKPKRPAPPPEPDADEWLAATSREALGKMK